MSSDSIALHTCCGPCGIAAELSLAERQILFTPYFINPSIHPLMEYERRLLAFREWSLTLGVECVEVVEYGLEAFLARVTGPPERRCRACVGMRLEATARLAREHGRGAFSTTLLASPLQRHDEIRTVGREIAERLGMEFLDHDLRSAFREGQARALSMGLYRQTYCGCIFSEAERYAPRLRRLGITTPSAPGSRAADDALATP